MKWRTEVEISKGPRPISYQDEVVVLGSCFADQLGKKLAYYQFRHLANPFGVLFHPVPLERLMRRSVKGIQFTEADLFEHEQLWRSLEVHSRITGNSSESTLNMMNRALDSLGSSLSRSSHVVFTLGTAFAFRYKDNDTLVANCHKLPQEQFARELTPVSGLIRSLESMVSLIRGINSKTHILFTVSPIRHLRDGLVENQRSKAHLLSAVHELVDGQYIHYFPAYELLMDELRDYRFYDRDMTHPTEQAVDFVWDKFKESWLEPTELKVMRRVEAIRKQLGHRVLHEESPSGIASRKALIEKAKSLSAEYPFIHFDL